MLDEPGEVDEHLGRDVGDDARPFEQVGLMPADVSGAGRAGGHGMYFVARGHQLLRHVAAEEAGGSGQQTAGHATKSA